MARKKEKTGMQKAIEAAGSQAQLARDLGVTQQAVSAWLYKGHAPPARAREIEMQYGIPRASLVSAKLMGMLDSGVGL